MARMRGNGKGKNGLTCPTDGTCGHEHVPSEPKAHRHEQHRGHDRHHHVHVHKSRERRLLGLAIGITGSVAVIEFVGGWLSNSLALISDAGHMLTHLMALVLSLAAIWVASMRSGPEYSFGFYRSETLAALFNCFFLLAISAWILWEAYDKLLHPGEIAVLEMMAVATVGLVANLVTAVVLKQANPESDLNIQGAFLHMISDTVSSVGVVVGAVVIYYTGWTVVDPLVSVVITIMILLWVYRLARSSVRVLLERAPEGIDIERVERTVRKHIPEVVELHDIHIWEITTNMYNMTAHVLLENQSLHEAIPVLRKIKRVVKEEFNIGHANLQLECTCVAEEE